MWGTKEYFAPEVVDMAYGPQADVWALGCVLYEMLSGEQAFPVLDGDKEHTFYGRIKKGDFDLNKYVAVVVAIIIIIVVIFTIIYIILVI